MIRSAAWKAAGLSFARSDLGSCMALRAVVRRSMGSVTSAIASPSLQPPFRGSRDRSLTCIPARTSPGLSLARSSGVITSWRRGGVLGSLVEKMGSETGSTSPGFKFWRSSLVIRVSPILSPGRSVFSSSGVTSISRTRRLSLASRILLKSFLSARRRAWEIRSRAERTGSLMEISPFSPSLAPSERF